MNKWNYKCPICGNDIQEDYSEEEIKKYIGATHDCPNCGGLLMIEEDLSCADFGKELSRRYAEMGINVSPEEASGSYIEI